MWKQVKPNGEELVANLPDNREQLARDMVDAWDMKDLVQFAVDHLEENLANCDAKEFDSEWKNFYGE